VSVPAMVYSGFGCEAWNDDGRVGEGVNSLITRLWASVQVVSFEFVVVSGVGVFGDSSGSGSVAGCLVC